MGIGRLVEETDSSQRKRIRFWAPHGPTSNEGIVLENAGLVCESVILRHHHKGGLRCGLLSRKFDFRRRRGVRGLEITVKYQQRKPGANGISLASVLLSSLPLRRFVGAWGSCHSCMQVGYSWRTAWHSLTSNSPPPAMPNVGRRSSCSCLEET